MIKKLLKRISNNLIFREKYVFFSKNSLFSFMHFYFDMTKPLNFLYQQHNFLNKKLKVLK